MGQLIYQIRFIDIIHAVIAKPSEVLHTDGKSFQGHVFNIIKVCKASNAHDLTL